MGWLRHFLATLRAHPFMVGLGLLALFFFNSVLDWFVDPIIKLNVERWAESKGADKWLSNGAPDRVMDILAALYYTYIGPAVWPFLLGFATCAILFGIYDLRMIRSFHVPFRLRRRLQLQLPPTANLEGWVKSQRRDYDIVPGPFEVYGIRSDDGIDIIPYVRYRNRSKHPLNLGWLKEISGAEFELDGRVPEGNVCSGISRPFPPETTHSTSYGPIRIYEENNPTGAVTFAIRFGIGDEMQTAIVLNYVFTVLSYPEKKEVRTVLQAQRRETVDYYIKA